MFEAAVGKGHKPYDYQCCLACGEQGDIHREKWLFHGDPQGCRSRLINIPTGLGKTAAAVLAWLGIVSVAKPTALNAAPLTVNSFPWPHHYCLPMQILSEKSKI